MTQLAELPEARKALKERRFEMIGAVYHLETGNVSLLPYPCLPGQQPGCLLPNRQDCSPDRHTRMPIPAINLQVMVLGCGNCPLGLSQTMSAS
jgi:hypothetical protein